MFDFRSLCATVVLFIALPVAGQDGSGSAKERTVASAYEFFATMMVQGGNYQIESRFAGNPASFNEPTNLQGYGLRAPPGPILKISPSATDSCITNVRTSFMLEVAFPNPIYGGLVSGINPMGGPFKLDVEERPLGVRHASTGINWGIVTSVARMGSSVIVKDPLHELRFQFHDESIANRFAQAMEFLRTTCDKTADLAF